MLLKKTIISLVTAGAMLATLLPASALAADKYLFDQYGIDTPKSSEDYPIAGLRSTASDSEGNVWFATKGGGLVKKDAKTGKFRSWNQATAPALKASTVMAVDVDESTPGEKVIYIAQGTYPGEANKDKNFGVAVLKNEGTENEEIDYLKVGDKGLPSAYVQDVRVDAEGIVWIGTEYGLTKYDPDKDTYQSWKMKDGFPAESLDNIEIDDVNGGIWCGFYPVADEEHEYKSFQTKGGFSYFKDGEITTYKLESQWDEASASWKLADAWVRDISVDANGGAWIITSGTRQGRGITGDGGYLYYVEKPGAEMKTFRGYDLFKKQLKLGDPGDIRMVTFDRNGGMWIGTSFNGIIYIQNPDPVKGEFEVNCQFNQQSGAWMATNPNNVSVFDNVAWLEFYNDTLYSGGYNQGMVSHYFNLDKQARCMTATVKTTKAKAKKGKVTISWKKAVGYSVSSYAIYRSTSKDRGFKKVATVKNSKRSYTLSTKKLKKNKTYYYQVKGLGKINGMTVYTDGNNVKPSTVK